MGAALQREKSPHLGQMRAFALLQNTAGCIELRRTEPPAALQAMPATPQTAKDHFDRSISSRDRSTGRSWSRDSASETRSQSTKRSPPPKSDDSISRIHFTH